MNLLPNLLKAVWPCYSTLILAFIESYLYYLSIYVIKSIDGVETPKMLANWLKNKIDGVSALGFKTNDPYSSSKNIAPLWPFYVFWIDLIIKSKYKKMLTWF